MGHTSKDSPTTPKPTIRPTPTGGRTRLCACRVCGERTTITFHDDTPHLDGYVMGNLMCRTCLDAHFPPPLLSRLKAWLRRLVRP